MMILIYFRVYVLITTLHDVFGLQWYPERGGVLHTNIKYVQRMYVNVRRYGRKSPYFLNFLVATKHTWVNNVSFHFKTYEYLHNEYRRSFVEFKMKFCDLLQYEQFIGHTVASYGLKCPVPPGIYEFKNFTMPLHKFPNVFPFEKGRFTTTMEQNETGEKIGEGFVDVTFKNELKKKKRT